MSKQPTVSLIESLFSQTKEYIQNRFQLLKMKAIDNTAKIASLVITGVAVFVIFFICFIVFNIGIALLIGDLIGKSWAGFLILAALYAIAGFVLLSKRNKFVKSPLTGMLIRKFL